jgi:hypothetical protein
LAVALPVTAAFFTFSAGSKFPPKVRPGSDVELIDPTMPTLPVAEAIEPEQTGALDTPGVEKPLRLFAVYSGRIPSEGRAVLGSAEETSRTYVTGAVLENGAKLVHVFADRAELVRDERTYTLYLAHTVRSDVLADEPAVLSIGAYAPPEPLVERAGLLVTDILRTIPAYEGEIITGFLAYPGKRRNEFRRWGLEPGDLLVMAGGQPLNDISLLDALLEQLAAGITLEAEIARSPDERQHVVLDGSALLISTIPLTPENPVP